MKVQGIESRRVVVDITTEECMKGLAEYYNLTNVMFLHYQIYWKSEHNIVRYLVRLTEMANIATHGSDCYDLQANSLRMNSR